MPSREGLWAIFSPVSVACSQIKKIKNWSKESSTQGHNTFYNFILINTQPSMPTYIMLLIVMGLIWSEMIWLWTSGFYKMHWWTDFKSTERQKLNLSALSFKYGVFKPSAHFFVNWIQLGVWGELQTTYFMLPEPHFYNLSSVNLDIGTF